MPSKQLGQQVISCPNTKLEYAKARCFVEGTPVVVGILPPQDAAQLASRSDEFGITVFDVLDGLALAGVIAIKRHKPREEKEAAMREQVDTIFGQWEDEEEPLDGQLGESFDNAPVVTLQRHTVQNPTKREQAAASPSLDWKLTTVESDTKSSSKKRRWVTSLSLFGLTVLALICALPRITAIIGDGTAQATGAASSKSMAAASDKPRLLTKPIEEVRCGDRIPSQLPDGWQPENEPEPDPRTWRLVELELAKENGDKVEVKLLRPLAWLEQAGAISEGTFPVKVEELDIEGKAAVLRILPCPEIQRGEGQVVTGTFRHTCDSLVELYIEGEPEPIVCTSGHPIWSRDRSTFLPAIELHASETVQFIGGACRRVILVDSRKNESVVNNLEINRTHVFHVGDGGLLVHNSIFQTCDQYARKNQQEGDDIGYVEGSYEENRLGQRVQNQIQIPREEGTAYYNHWFIVRNGLVIDQKHPDGIPKAEWEAQLRALNKFIGKLLWQVDSLPTKWGDPNGT